MDAKTLKLHAGNGELGPLLTETQAIGLLGLGDRPKPKASLQWLRRSGQLGYVRVGRGIYSYPESEVRRFMEDRYRAPVIK